MTGGRGGSGSALGPAPRICGQPPPLRRQRYLTDRHAFGQRLVCLPELGYHFLPRMRLAVRAVRRRLLSAGLSRESLSQRLDLLSGPLSAWPSYCAVIRLTRVACQAIACENAVAAPASIGGLAVSAFLMDGQLAFVGQADRVRLGSLRFRVDTHLVRQRRLAPFMLYAAGRRSSLEAVVCCHAVEATPLRTLCPQWGVLQFTTAGS
jgi:hypothetical protein